jgi:hypothetical protein
VDHAFGVAPGDGVEHVRRAGDVPLQEPVLVCGGLGDRRRPPGVETGDLVAGVDELYEDVRPDEPVTAGDQDSHTRSTARGWLWFAAS